jgi:hypothetical protein
MQTKMSFFASRARFRNSRKVQKKTGKTEFQKTGNSGKFRIFFPPIFWPPGNPQKWRFFDFWQNRDVLVDLPKNGLFWGFFSIFGFWHMALPTCGYSPGGKTCQNR